MTKQKKKYYKEIQNVHVVSNQPRKQVFSWINSIDCRFRRHQPRSQFGEVHRPSNRSSEYVGRQWLFLCSQLCISTTSGMSVADDNIYCATDDSTSFWAVWELWILRLLPRTSYLMSFVFFLQIKRRTDQRTPQLRLTQLQTHPSHIQGPLYHPQHFSQHFNHCGFYTYVDNTGSSLTTARLFHR